MEKKERKFDSGRYIYDMVNLIKECKRLGRPLTDKEIKPFIIGERNHESYYD